MSGRKWTPEEDMILKKEFPKYGTNCPSLKGRTIRSIRAHAYQLGIASKVKKWTVEEDMILRKEYPKYGSNCPSLKGRTIAAIRVRAKKVGLKFRPGPRNEYVLRDGTKAIVKERIDYKTFMAEFPNGKIYRCNEDCLRRGSIPRAYSNDISKQAPNFECILKDGTKAIIKKRIDWRTVLAEFPNEKIYRCRLDHLKEGRIPNEYINDTFIGYTNRATCGLDFRVIKLIKRVNDNNHWFVLFEDGATATAQKPAIMRGQVGHPVLRTQRNRKNAYKTYLAKWLPSEKAFDCECQICGRKAILTAKELIEGCPNCDSLL